MSVHTTYDDMRDNLTECLKLAKELLDENIWGYDEMRSNYAIDVYLAVKAARDKI